MKAWYVGTKMSLSCPAEPCVGGTGVVLPTCPVCHGEGEVLPMRARTYETCLAIVAKLRAAGTFDDPHCRETLALTGLQWWQLQRGALSVVEVDRIARELGVE